MFGFITSIVFLQNWIFFFNLVEIDKVDSLVLIKHKPIDFIHSFFNFRIEYCLHSGPQGWVIFSFSIRMFQCLILPKYFHYHILFFIQIWMKLLFKPSKKKSKWNEQYQKRLSNQHHRHFNNFIFLFSQVHNRRDRKCRFRHQMSQFSESELWIQKKSPERLSD